MQRPVGFILFSDSSDPPGASPIIPGCLWMSQGAKLFVNSIPNSLNVELEFLENGLNTTFQEVYVD
jgi:hypothetical protein